MRKISRAKFLATIAASPILGLSYAWGIERHWLDEKEVVIDANGVKIAHISDIHYSGDKNRFQDIVDRINKSGCKYVFFTGDLTDYYGREYLDEVLELITGFKIPTYGVPGNHDLIDSKSIKKHKRAFIATGGDWLFDEYVELKEFDLYGTSSQQIPERMSSKKSILLTHYPATANCESEHSYDLILAGHSHGGQVRIPFFGAIHLPARVGNYDRGLFETKRGKLYVNVGIGTFFLPIRFCCRPELTMLTV